MRFGAWGPEYGGIYPATDKGYYVNLLRKLDIISGGRKDNWALCCSVPTNGRKQRREDASGDLGGGKTTGHDAARFRPAVGNSAGKTPREIQGAEIQLGTMLLGSDQRSETTPGRRLGRSGGRKDGWAQCCSVPTNGRKQRR